MYSGMPKSGFIVIRIPDFFEHLESRFDELRCFNPGPDCLILLVRVWNLDSGCVKDPDGEQLSRIWTSPDFGCSL